jgi:hypothetical protein
VIEGSVLAAQSTSGKREVEQSFDSQALKMALERAPSDS